MVEAFRITKTKFVSSAFDGEGARLFGGRWNSVGTRMVYLGGTLSGATLELLIHTDDHVIVGGLYSYFRVEIPDEVVGRVEVHSLPDGWASPTPTTLTQAIGDRWIAGSSSAVLRVPSAITAGEFNFLTNPAHADFAKLKIGKPVAFEINPRI